MKIVRQETRTGPCNNHHPQGRHILPVNIGNIGDAYGRYGCNSRSQSVQPVNKVYRIGYGNEPDYRDDEAGYFPEHHVSITKVVCDEFYSQAQCKGNNSAYCLSCQLHYRLHASEVINHSHNVDAGAPNHCRNYSSVLQSVKRQSYHYRHIYCHAAESWHRLVMNSSLVLGHIHGADFRCQLNCQGCYRRPAYCRHNKRSPKVNTCCCQLLLPSLMCYTFTPDPPASLC